MVELNMCRDSTTTIDVGFHSESSFCPPLEFEEIAQCGGTNTVFRQDNLTPGTYIIEVGTDQLIRTSAGVPYTIQITCTGGDDPVFNLLNSVEWERLNLVNELQFQEFRDITGRGNNIDDPELGAIDSHVKRCIPPAYGDGINEPAGLDRTNPREISNVLCNQDPEELAIHINDRFLTQWAWEFGQFIDHDVTLISEDTSALNREEDMDIYVPCCDRFHDPLCECEATRVMEVFRTQAVDGTGENGVPREQINEITAFIDASTIYGHTEERARAVRYFYFFIFFFFGGFLWVFV